MNVEGTVYVEVTCQIRMALSRATAGWNDRDKAEIIAGKTEARRELIQQVAYEARMTPDDVQIEVADIRVSEPVAAQQTGGDPS